MKYLVTGGAGFIGSAFVRAVMREHGNAVVNIDKLTYAGNLESLAEVESNPGYNFLHGDINDSDLVTTAFREHQPDAVLHFAAETHVDRSIDAADAFVRTNVNGTFALLDAARSYWQTLEASRQSAFRFVHVSTDEVFGDLGEGDGQFREASPYAPSSPYSATKAAGDHLVRAWHRTYGLPTIVTNCSNAYGSHQFPEKFVPHVILNALRGQPLPLYGDGLHARDWNHVEDMVAALLLVARAGVVGESYVIGTGQAVSNLALVETLCELLDRHGAVAGSAHRDLITFVADRPGHDRRYCVDSTKLRNELSWQPSVDLRTGLESTVDWYLTNEPWWRRILSGDYRLSRLGTGT